MHVSEGAEAHQCCCLGIRCADRREACMQEVLGGGRLYNGQANLQQRIY